MKSLKPIQYILILVLITLIFAVIFNLNFDSKSNLEKETSEKQNISNEINYKNIVYNGSYDFYDNGGKFASINFKSIKEKDDGLKIVEDFQINLIKSRGKIKCKKATIDSFDNLKLMEYVQFTNFDESVIIDFTPPVYFKKKILTGNNFVKLTDKKNNQELSGTSFKFITEKKLFHILNNSIFRDIANEINVNSKASFTDFKNNTVLFINDVLVDFKSEKNKLITDILFYNKLNSVFHFSGFSKVSNKNIEIKLSNGIVEKNEDSYIFKSNSIVNFETIDILGKAKEMEYSTNLLKLTDMIVTNGLYNIYTPKCNFYTIEKNLKGKSMFVYNNEFTLSGKDYTFDLQKQYIKLNNPVARNLNKNINITSEILEIKDKNEIIFSGNVYGNFKTKKFKSNSLKYKNKEYLINKLFVLEKVGKLSRTLSSNNALITKNIITGKGNVVFKENNKLVKSDKVLFKKNNVIFSDNVTSKFDNIELKSNKAYINKGYSLFLNGKLKKDKNYYAQSDIILQFKSNKIFCIGNALFIDKSTGKATGDSLTLDNSADTITLIGKMEKAKVEYNYEKKTSSK